MLGWKRLVGLLALPLILVLVSNLIREWSPRARPAQGIFCQGLVLRTYLQLPQRV